MKAYFDYQPHAILIREKSDGQADRIIGEITPEVLIGMARICHGAMRDGILAESDDDWDRRSSKARREHGLPPLPSYIGEEREPNATNKEK